MDGLGDEAYTKQQFALEEVPMPPDSFFGKQMTVETALFRDVWNIAGDELLG